MQLTAGVFYFFLMEFLQYFQYLVIDDCSNPTNQILTVLGLVEPPVEPLSFLVQSHNIYWSPRLTTA